MIHGQNALHSPVERLTIEEGLPQNYVTEVVEDRQGFLWMSTMGGLVRYDGSDFLQYADLADDTSGLSTLQIIDIHLRGDHLYLLHENRKVDIVNVVNLSIEADITPLYKIHKDSFLLRFNWQNTSRMIVGEDNNWYTDDKDYYYLYDSAVLKSPIGKAFFEPRKTVKYINSYLAEEDSCWVFTNEALKVVDENLEVIQVLTPPDSLRFEPNLRASQEFLYRIFDHYLFFGYKHNLFLYDLQAATFQRLQLPLRHYGGEDNIKKIVFDSRGLPYFIFSNHVFRLEQDLSFSLIWRYPAQGIFILRSIFMDSRDQLWLGSDGDGLYRIDLTAPYFHQTAIENNFVVDLLLNYEGYTSEMLPSALFKPRQAYGFRYFDADRRYFAYQKWYNGGPALLYKIEQDEVREVRASSGNAEYNLNLYVGVDQVNDTLEAFTISGKYDRWHDLSSPPERSWIWRDIFEEDRMPSRKEFVIHNIIHFVSDQKALWILTKKSLIRRAREGDAKKTFHDFTSGGSFLFLLQDPVADSILWIGTISDGLLKFDKESLTFIKQYTEKEGLVNNNIASIVPDAEGRLWIGTFNGISVFDPVKERFRNFSKNDGLLNPEFDRHHGYRLSDGRIAFAGAVSLTVFDPARLRGRKPILQPKITALTVNDSLVILQDLGLYLFGSKKLALTHDQNNLRVDFASFDYQKDPRMRFRYKLKGGSGRWLDLDKKRSFRLDNLNAGRYELLVNAGLRGESWPQNYTSMSFEIEPPLWLTWWAKLGYGLLIIVSVALLVMEQQRRVAARKEKEFQKKEIERNKELVETKDRLYSNITHEFRTPLTLIMSPTDDALKKMSLTPELKKILQSNLTNAGNMLDLVNQLLDLSKMESGQMNGKLFVTNINFFINQLVDNFQLQANKKRISLELKESYIAGPFQVEKEYWDRIISNLLSNAVKFTPQSGKIKVEYRLKEIDDKQYIRFSISDSGPGIKEDEQEKIFQRFYQTDSGSNRKYEGTGIGLSLVKELLDLIGGDIEVQSTPGRGSTFTVLLPLHQVVNNSIAKNTAKVIAENSDRPYVVLIAEDNEELRTILVQSLSDSYHILEAKDGEEAMSKIEQELPDLIISDVMMPGMDGYELCEKVKQDLRYGHIGFFILTAKAAESSLIRGFSAGADEYLSKPFNIEELQLRVKNYFLQSERLRIRAKTDILSPENSSRSPDYNTAFKRQMDQIVLSNLDNSNLKVEDIAQELAMSKSTLNRKMKAIFGLSCNEYCRQFRLSESLRYLKDGNSVAQTSYLVGFDNPSYFSTCFKEKYGKIPSEFVKDIVSR